MYFFFTESSTGGGGGEVDLSPIYASSTGTAISARDISKLFQDVSGTTPITAAGQTVALAQKAYGNDDDYTQSISAREPTYTVDGGGNPYFNFDGTDDSFDITDTTLSGTTLTIFAIVNIDAADDNGILWSNLASASQYIAPYDDGSANATLAAGCTFGSMYIDNSLVSVTTRDDMHTQMTGSLKTILVNVSATALSGTQVFGKFYNVTTFSLAGPVYATGWVSPAVTTADDRTLIHNWLLQEAGQ